jgi:hypothetical protein
MIRYDTPNECERRTSTSETCIAHSEMVRNILQSSLSSGNKFNAADYHATS